LPEIDHKTLIASLNSEERRSLLVQTDRDGLIRFAWHFGSIIALAALITFGAAFQALLILILGILICFLFTLLHETVHRTPFKTDTLNIWVSRLCGFLTFLGPEWFRYFHFAHHRYTHDPDNDPELLSPKPQTLWQYITYLSGLPDWRDRCLTLVRNAIRHNDDSYVPARGKAKVMREARVQLALYGAIIALSVAFQTALLIKIWLLPILLGGPFLCAYLLTEHVQCEHVPSMLENTRTTLTNRVVRFIAWNMPYHVEHHAYHSVPFHKLPEFHQHTQAHIKHLDEGYARFNRDFARSVIET
jgi:fatty acid desaturase